MADVPASTSSLSAVSQPPEEPAKPLTPAEQRVEAAITQVKGEIASLEGELKGADADQIVKYHHDLLHKYNMRKDATQILIGKIATVERATVAEISLKLGLDPTD